MKRLLLASFALAVTALTGLSDGDGSELWLHLGGKHDLNSTNKISVAGQVKFDDDFTEFYNYSVDVGFHRPLKLKWFDARWQMSANARVDGYKNDGDWQQELRPHLNLASVKKRGNYIWINRARVEYRIFEERSDIVRFRHKIEMAHPIRGFNNGLSAFLSEEYFIDSDEGQFSENRIMAGVKRRITRWSGKAYVMDRAIKEGTQFEHNLVLGLSAYTRF